MHLADSDGLVAVDPSTGEPETLTDGGGIPAQPIVVGGELVAAWVAVSSGHLWTSAGDDVPLAIDGDLLDDVDEIIPVLRSNGERAVLNETASGMLWRVPDGQLIPVAQWTLEDENDRDEGTVQVDDVAEQEPPVAVDDAFGVRAGAQVRLPVLLNDHDPNKRDVLTIRSDTVSALSDPAFGEISLASNNQEAVVRVSATSGSATFTYSVTDGQAVSEPATVTLTVVPDDVNTAPEWCGVEACVQEWPTPSIAPGGTVTVPVLSGWVDPEGDLFVLSDAQAADADAPLSVVATASGEVAVRHLDPNASDATLPVVVTVMDSRGATAERELVISVSSNPVLEAKPIAIVAGVGEKASVPVTRHVTGGSGALRLLDAVESSTTGGALSVVPNAASGEVDLVASEPGEYLVTYTVQDSQTQAEQSALVRLTAVAGGAPLSMAPQAAFVRPNEDTTVDVLSAVQNTGGRVLLVAEASTGDPTLSVDVVGQSRVRVSGTTDDGRPGRVGEAQVTVADGSGASVEGSLTVFLVAASSGVAPIAVPDSVTVRAENQIDIPVTANDVSPRGERLIVHPTVEGSGASGELVFAAGSRLRYLAPSEPGVYTVRYSVYLENSPTRIDTTTVTVTVVAAGSNRAPQPSVLTARVLSGQTVSIAVPSSGSDPDGDRVVLSEVTQPDAGQGVASISAEGDAILYTAPAGGVEGGQLSFGYTVRDPDGAEGSAEVRVGVLSRVLSDTAPIAYSDYVRVQVGSEAPVRVAPMRNDRDPAQGTLELVSLVPNAPTSEGNPEYARLEGLVDAETSLADGEVVLRGGDVLGAHSYIYTVRSTTSSSTSQGLVVVNVTDAPAPDHPVVEDTVLTAKDRRDFATGVDVVSGKVDWASGDVSSLRLSLWQESSRYEVDGFSIRGDLPDRGALVPFTLTGEDSAGAPAIAHGFLRIPAFDDMRVQLRPDLDPVEVGEEKSVDFQVGEILDLDRADSIEVRSEGPFAVQRANARCTPASGLTVRYDAGRESPWSDSCTVSVRLDGQTRWSPLAVPIAVEPKDPQAILNSVSRTVAPGASEDLDMLASMTTWEGGREGDAARLDFSVSHGGSAFIVTQSGTSVSFEARADARPGTRETVQVSVSSFGGLTAAVTLVVGAAPADSPRGATFRTQCTVSAGSCTIP
ncbi:MAG: Ig-like domain-containing protein, partial [Aeromicrobium sp.]